MRLVNALVSPATFFYKALVLWFLWNWFAVPLGAPT